MPLLAFVFDQDLPVVQVGEVRVPIPSQGISRAHPAPGVDGVHALKYFREGLRARFDNVGVCQRPSHPLEVGAGGALSFELRGHTSRIRRRVTCLNLRCSPGVV